ncbi:hypothetical protein ACFC1B_27045 [Streptomyces xiamenensis]|uniref:hypothetical protein n=1 Tax=Streptomyces xiamenensis TaxID=408015 RepID=UPI0035E16424
MVVLLSAASEYGGSVSINQRESLYINGGIKVNFHDGPKFGRQAGGPPDEMARILAELASAVESVKYWRQKATGNRYLAELVGHLYQARKEVRRAEAWHVVGLMSLAVVGYLVAYYATHGLMERVPSQGFQPADTAQVITAVSALATSIGIGIAAIVKAYALLVQARADMIRAKASLPPVDETTFPAIPDAEPRRLPGPPGD